MKERFYYDIHEIVTVASDAPLPELEMFNVEDEIEKPTIDVTIGRPSRKAHTPGASHLFYKEAFGMLGFEADIERDENIKVTASPLLKHSPHVLYTNLVEPILRWTFADKGYALVHGATITFDGRAYMITARTDTGKTTTLLKILNHQRRGTDCASFISDDLTLVAPNGTVLTYPKPLTISAHTVRAVNSALLNRGERIALPFQSRIHSRGGRKFAFTLNHINLLPMATINAIVQFIVPPPKYHVQRLVPKVKLAPQAKLTGLFIIERGMEMDVALDPQEALKILLSNCEDAFGFPPYHSIKEFLYKDGEKDLRPIEQGIIRQALTGIPATLIRSNTLEWWRRIPAFVGDDVAMFFALPAESQTMQINREAVRA
jgi:hypothetical protein